MTSLLLLILCTIFLSNASSDYDSPALIKWNNSLDTAAKLKLFLDSSALFGREQVTIHQGTDGKPRAYLGVAGDLELVQALYKVGKARKDHQVMLVFNSPDDFKDAFNDLTLNNHNWIWYNFPIEKGPNNDDRPVDYDDFYKIHTNNMRQHPLAFGFTSSQNFGKGAYTLTQMQGLVNKTDLWYSKLGYSGQFMVEIGMHVLLNTTGHSMVMEPVTSSLMSVCFATVEPFQDFIVGKKGEIRAIARFYEKKRIFMNIPETLRNLLAPANWWGNSTSSASRGPLMYQLPLYILWNIYNL